MYESIVRKNRVLAAVAGLLSSRFKILAYHSVYAQSRDLYEISAGMFAEQMKIIASQGFKVVTLEEAYHSLLNKNIGSRAIVITFDDGFQSLRDYAFPILKELEFPATVFLPFDYVGGVDSFSYGRPRHDFRILSYREIGESMLQRISYGSHTMSHSDLTSMDKQALAKELRESKRALNEKLGTRFSALAYPFGMFNEQVQHATSQAGYDCAMCFGNVLSNSCYTNRFQMKREKILSTTSIEQFKQLIDIRFDFRRKFNTYLKC